MRRREFITLLGGAAQRGRLPVSGFFSRASREVTKSLRSPTRLRGFNICRRARTNRAGACWRR